MTQKCPKCGHANPDDVLFCTECDWRVDVPYQPENKGRNPLLYSAIVCIIGIVATVTAIINQNLVAIVTGIVALLFGGYSMGLTRILEGNKKTPALALSAIGLMTGVIGFIIGLYNYFGSERWQSIVVNTFWRDSPPFLPRWSIIWTSLMRYACHSRTVFRAKCAVNAAISLISS